MKKSVFFIIILAITLLGALSQINAYLPSLSTGFGLIMFFDGILMLVGVVLTWLYKKSGVYLTFLAFLIGLILLIGTSNFNINALVTIANIVLFYIVARPVLSK